MCPCLRFQMDKADKLYCQIVRLYVYCPKETIEHIIQVCTATCTAEHIIQVCIAT